MVPDLGLTSRPIVLVYFLYGKFANTYMVLKSHKTVFKTLLIFSRLLGIQNKYVRGMLLSNYFTVNEWKFDTTNTEGLANSLSKSDQDTYNFDVTRISWPQYLEKCSLGVKRFLHKEGPNVDQIGARHMTR